MPSQKPVFTVEYANTKKDLFELNLFVVDLPDGLLKSTKSKLIISIISALLVYAISFLSPRNIFVYNNVFVYVVLFVLLIGFFYIEISFLASKKFQKLILPFRIKIFEFRGGEFPNFYDQKKLEYYEDRVVVTLENQTITRAYNGYESFSETEKYLFLKVKMLKRLYIVLPKKYYTTEQIEFIKQKID